MFKGFIFEDDHISRAAPPISNTVSDSLSEGSVIWGDMLIKKTLNEKGTGVDRKKNYCGKVNSKLLLETLNN